MYKVFVNDKQIILTDSKHNVENYPRYNYENLLTEEILHRSKENTVGSIVLFCKDLEKSWNDFQKSFKIVKAAGGLVTNEKNEFLFIYRNNRWDLPKGKIEKNEPIRLAAVREVREECGIHEISLTRKLVTTYHIFTLDHQNILKPTHWFAMQTSSGEKLTPQVEEGITCVAFKNKPETEKALKNTYANIHLVFESFYNEK